MKDPRVKYFKKHIRELIEFSDLFEPDLQGKSHTCPICQNGQSGGTGDGIVINDQPGQYYGTFHCYKCGFHGTLVDLMGPLHDLKEQEEMINQAMKDFKVSNIPVYAPKSGQISTKEGKGYNYMGNTKKINYGADKGPKPKVYPLEQEVRDLIEGKITSEQELIEQSQANRDKYPEFSEYVKKERGLSDEAIEHYGLGFIPGPGQEYHYTKDGEAKRFFLKDHVIFPSSPGSWNARRINECEKKDRFFKSVGHPNVPLGIQWIIEEKDKEMDEAPGFLEPIFLVEGSFDAPSVYDAGGDAVALGSMGINQFIAIYQDYKIERPVLLCLDNEADAKEQQTKNLNKLLEAGIKAYSIDLTGAVKNDNGKSIKDANELLTHNKAILIERVKRARNTEYIEWHEALTEYNESLTRNRFKSYTENLINGQNDKIPTGFNTLDGSGFLDGGLSEGLYVIGAISALGKTALALQIADQIATAGHDVIYYSLEMGEDELRDRSISRYTAKKIIDDGQLYQNKGFGDFNRFAKTQTQIRHELFKGLAKDKANMTDEQSRAFEAIDHYFKDTGEHLRIVEGVGNFDADKIIDMVKKHIDLTGNKPVIFIDYLQLLVQPQSILRSMTDKQITDLNVLKLKQLSRDYSIPIFAISSLNRDSYDQSVTMKSYKESGAIEYTTSILWGLQRVNHDGDQNKLNAIKKQEYETGVKHLELVFLKNRNGKADGSVKFDFYSMFNYFKEADGKEMPMIQEPSDFEPIF